MAGLGAGTVTAFAVSQGQHPLQALAISALAIGFAIACKRSNLA